MSLSNFGKKEIPTSIKSIDKEIIEDQEREFGPILSETEKIKNRELLLKEVKGSSNEPIVEEVRVVKESKEENNAQIQEVLESIRKSNI